MLPTAIVLEVRRLLDEDALSQRQIAARLRVSRGVVGAIALGSRGLHGRESLASVQSSGAHEATPSRCASCGGMVYKPCLLCRARTFKSRAQRSLRRSSPRCLPLTPRRVA